MDESDEIYEGMTKMSWDEIGGMPFEKNRNFEFWLHELITLIESALSSSELLAVRESLAIGTLKRRDFNAMCIKSLDGWHAIVINYGLFMYLNLFSRLSEAVRDPACVTYCDFGNKATLKSADYQGYLEYTVQQYAEHRTVYGPKIKLNKDGALMVGVHLLIGELLVLGHELGHFLNGDLEDKNNLEPHHEFTDVQMLVEDKDRVIEMRADIKGYALMKDCMEKNMPETAKQAMLFNGLMSFMDAMYFVTLDKGRSHPTTIERTVGIAKHFYGQRIADIAARSFEDREATFQLFGELTRLG